MMEHFQFAEDHLQRLTGKGERAPGASKRALGVGENRVETPDALMVKGSCAERAIGGIMPPARRSRWP